MSAQSREMKIGFTITICDIHPTEFKLEMLPSIFSSLESAHRYIEHRLNPLVTDVVSITPIVVDAKYKLVDFK